MLYIVELYVWGGKYMKELMWRIFENSGHIESYLLYKGFIDCQGEKNEEADNEDSAHAGDSPKVL